MTKYLQKSFSVNYGGTDSYRANWDAIFNRPTWPPPDSSAVFTPEMVAILEECKRVDLESEPATPDPPPIVGTIIRAQVQEFHRKFGLPVRTSPTIPHPDEVYLRLRLITEEYFELLEACGIYGYPVDSIQNDILYAIRNENIRVDIVDVADALADLDYVIEGTRLVFGINGLPISVEVHRSNMSKLWPDGEPRYREDGKVLKPPNYSPADVYGEIEKQR